MEQKTVDRNELLLSGNFDEQFGDISVTAGDNGFCISVPCGGGFYRWHQVDKNDAERFAQAVLVHSGAWKVE